MPRALEPIDADAVVECRQQAASVGTALKSVPVSPMGGSGADERRGTERGAKVAAMLDFGRSHNLEIILDAKSGISISRRQTIEKTSQARDLRAALGDRLGRSCRPRGTCCDRPSPMKSRHPGRAGVRAPQVGRALPHKARDRGQRARQLEAIGTVSVGRQANPTSVQSTQWGLCWSGGGD